MSEHMDEATTERARVMAWKVARHVARRCWWADIEELVQAALLQVVVGYPSYDPARQVFDAWAGEVCKRAVYRALIRASAPTSGHQHEPASVKGVARAPLEDIVHHATHDRPDRAYFAARKLAAIRAELVVALGSEGSAEFALAVLGGEWSAAELAEANDLPVQQVYATTTAVRRRLEESPSLYRLWLRGDEGE